MTVSTKSIAA